MSKRILVIGGAVLLVGLLIAVWIYVMFIGTPRELPEGISLPWGSSDQSLSLPAPDETTVDPAETSTEIPNFATIPLKQLTTRPVIGYREIATSTTASSSPGFLYYAEAGTGHIYQIDLMTGIETRRSGTTIIEAADAVFSPDGKYVVFRSGYGRSPKTILGTFTPDGLTTTDLGLNIDQYTITAANTLLYSQKDTIMRAYSRTLPSGTSQSLFTLPFREATILWGNSASDSHVVFPRPSYLLPGALYEVKGGKMTRLPFEGFGLSAFRSGSLVGVGYLDKPEVYVSYVYDLMQKEVLPNNAFLPEKCTGSVAVPDKIWCSGINEKQSVGFPDTWHRGEHRISDDLFTFVPNLLTFHGNLSEKSGRAIDLISPQATPSGSGVYFINRLDNSLWRYLEI